MSFAEDFGILEDDSIWIEGTYSGNFSNSYKEGTKYYSIKGIDTNEAIAIQENDEK